ncbi:MAG TPA: YciI family protein [Longimicrobiales bacterium]
MRFLLIVKANADTEAGKLPSDEMMATMGKFNEELMKAGVLLDLNGLHPTSTGVRIRHSDGQRSVLEGPFPGSGELIAGYWLIQVRSREEAIEWALRAPAPHGEGNEGEIEVRQVYEVGELGSGEAVERERGLDVVPRR